MRKKFTMLLASMLCAFTSNVMAQTYTPGNRTTTLEAGKQYFISVATYYGSACTNLLYNNDGTLAKSDLLPSSATDNAAYLFTVEEVGEGYLAYIKNSDGKYLQADNLASTDTKTGVYVIPYFEGKAVCCGSDVDACDENGNRIAHGNITAETPIVTIQKNAEYTVADNRNGWRYINGLSAGVNWCTAFAFYEVADGDAALTEAKALLNEKIVATEALLTAADFASTGGEIALQATTPTGAGYISCSNIDPTEGSDMNYLIDGNNSTYIHTNWHSASSSNDYLTVYLGEGNGVSLFQFSEVTRSGASADYPKSVQILGSTDGDEYTEVTVVDGLPQSGGQSYTSEFIECDPSYVYLRFVVTTGTNRIYFHMAEFGLSTPLTVTTNAEYKSKDKVLYGLSLALARAQEAVNSTDLAAINEAVADIEEYMAEATKVYPFTLTTDDENPVLYAIKSGRGDAYWYTYDSNDGMIALSQYTGDNTQLWFFKEVATDDYKCALQLYPYADAAKAMSYQNTDNNPAKIVAQSLDTEGYTNLWLLASTDGDAPYGLQTYNKANYLSNNGGVTNKMGMWNAAPSADSGTAMYFVTPAQALQDLINVAKGYEAGTTVGHFTSTSIANLQTAITAAETDFANNKYSTADLQAAIDALETVQPEEGKFYVIKSATSESDSRSGKKIYVNNNGGMNFEDATTMAHVFQFVDAGDNTFYLKSVERGTYLSTNNGHGAGQQQALALTTEGAKALAIANMGRENVVSLIPVGGAMIHAQVTNSAVVAWNNSSNTEASAWIIEEISLEEVAHSVTISATAKWSTLVLGYNAIIPTGVKAYAVTATGDEYATLTEVTGVIPAGEAVLLNADNITENATYDFKYAETATTTEGNLLEGTTINTYVAGSAYVLANGTNGIGLYKAALNKDASGVEGTTHFLNNANKAYLPVSSNAPMFSLERGEGTTNIESIVNGQQSTVIYDLTGRRVEKMEKGIYIVNGKKIIK